MSKKLSKAATVAEKILTGSFPNTDKADKLAAERSRKLKEAKHESLVGSIVQAGCMANETFYVQFNSGGGWASAWPEWAYAIARDALLHGKLVRVIYQGAAPYGDNLVAVLLVV